MQTDGRYVSSGTFDLFSSALSWIVSNVCETQMVDNILMITACVKEHFQDIALIWLTDRYKYLGYTVCVNNLCCEKFKKFTFDFPRCNRTATPWYRYIIFYQKIGRVLMRLFCDLLKWEPERVIVHLLRKWVKVTWVDP